MQCWILMCLTATGGDVQYVYNDYIALGWWHSPNHSRDRTGGSHEHMGMHLQDIYVGHECANAHRCIHIHAHALRFNYSSGVPLKTASLIQTLSILQQSHVLNIPHQLEIKVNTLWAYGSARVHICECCWFSKLALSFIYVVSWLTVLASFKGWVMALLSFTHFLSNLKTFS